MGSSLRVLGKQPAVLGTTPRVLRLFPPWRAARAARGLVPSPRACRIPFLRGPSTHRRSGLRKSLDRKPGPVCRVGGGGFSGAEFAPFPSPCLLPPAGMGWLFSGVSQSRCFANHQRCVRPVNFSLALPQFKKLPPTALRAFGLVPTLSNAARSSPFRSYLLVAGAGVWGTFLLGVAFRHVICGPYLISPPS